MKQQKLFAAIAVATSCCLSGLQAQSNNFSLEKANSQSYIDATSYILNPSFQAGNGGTFEGVNQPGNTNVPANWTLKANTTWIDSAPNRDNPHNGDVCWNIWSGTVNELDLHQTITLPAGKYSLSAYLRTEKDEQAVNQRVYAQIGDGISYSSALLPKSQYCSGEWNSFEAWQKLDVEFTVTDDNTAVRIGASSTGGDGSIGWFQIDDFQLISFVESDLTSTYLKNYDFEASPVIFIADADGAGNPGKNSLAEKLGTKGWVHSIPGWTNESSDNTAQVSTAEYNVDFTSSYGNGLNTVNPPASDINGEGGVCIHMSAGWNDKAIITQAVSLLGGKYTLSYDVYNAHTATSIVNSYCGYIADGVATYDSSFKSLSQGVWETRSVTFNAIEGVSGKISIGFTTSANGSGNGAKLFVDNIKLEYLGNDKGELKDKIAEAEATYNEANAKAENLKNTIDAAKAVIDNEDATQSEILAAIASLENALFACTLADATVENPYEMTSFLVNPDFEGGISTLEGSLGNNGIGQPEGWKLDYSVDGWKDFNTVTVNPKSGSKILNAWAGTTNKIDLYQTVNLPAGQYTLTAAMRSENEKISNQRIYAIAHDLKLYSSVLKAPSEIGNPEWNSYEAWQVLEVEFYVTEDNTPVTIGASSTGGGSSLGWFQLDDFRLNYTSSDFSAINAIVKTDLIEKVEAVENVDYKGVGTELFQKPVAAKNSLMEAMAAIKDLEITSLAVYQNALNDLNAAVSAYDEVMLNQPLAKTAYNFVLAGNGTDYDSKVLTWSNDRPAEGFYNIRLVDEAEEATPTQQFYFIPLEDVNCYNIRFIDADNKDRFLCLGEVYGGTSAQLRTSSEFADAAIFKAVHNGDYTKIKNVVNNNFVGTTDGGFFTTNSNNNYSFKAIDNSITSVLDAPFELNEVSIALNGNSLSVLGADNYTVYTVQGAVYANCSGSETVVLSQGIYLVKANGKVTKVLVK